MKVVTDVKQAENYKLHVEKVISRVTLDGVPIPSYKLTLEILEGVATLDVPFLDSLSEDYFIELLTRLDPRMAEGHCLAREEAPDLFPGTIEKLLIPSTVKEIDPRIWWKLAVLEEVQISPENCWYTLVNDVLYTGDLKTLVKYPPQKPEPYFAVPDHVAHIGEGAFVGVHNLKCMKVGANVTSVGEDAFCNASFHHIYFDKNVTELPAVNPFYLYYYHELPCLPNYLVIGGPAGSAIEEFCILDGNFIAIGDDEVDQFLVVPDTGNNIADDVWLERARQYTAKRRSERQKKPHQELAEKYPSLNWKDFSF